ncbi:hypothetical protein [Mailhella massiliensis]|nr:hypothetical protein [Mailhella massiliensis]
MTAAGGDSGVTMDRCSDRRRSVMFRPESTDRKSMNNDASARRECGEQK